MLWNNWKQNLFIICFFVEITLIFQMVNGQKLQLYSLVHILHFYDLYFSSPTLSQYLFCKNTVCGLRAQEHRIKVLGLHPSSPWRYNPYFPYWWSRESSLIESFQELRIMNVLSIWQRQKSFWTCLPELVFLIGCHLYFLTVKVKIISCLFMSFLCFFFFNEERFIAMFWK